MGAIYSAKDFDEVLKPIECTLGNETVEIFYQHNAYCKFVCVSDTDVEETFHCERGRWHSEMLGIQTVEDIRNIMWSKCAAVGNLSSAVIKDQERFYSWIHCYKLF